MESKHLQELSHQNNIVRLLAQFVFASRWLQAPLYFGLIVAQAVYVYHFAVELTHLVQHTTTVTETEIMLVVLGLIDVVMIANLLLMVIVAVMKPLCRVSIWKAIQTSRNGWSMSMRAP